MREKRLFSKRRKIFLNIGSNSSMIMLETPKLVLL